MQMKKLYLLILDFVLKNSNLGKKILNDFEKIKKKIFKNLKKKRKI